MQRTHTFKVVTIALLGLLLLLPLGMIRGQIEDRADYRDRARQGIAESWTGAQTVIGPMLVVPYSVTVTRKVGNRHTGRQERVEEEARRRLVLVPETLRADIRLETQRRRRGIFSIPVYTSRHSIKGRFNLAAVQALAREKGFRGFGRPFLALHLADSRGIAAAPRLRWDGRALEAAAGSGIAALSQGLQAELPAAQLQQDGAGFELALQLRGMESLAVAPVGRDSRIRLTSSWPHPSFSGRYLPQDHAIDADGFEAEWQLSRFATNAQDQAQACLAGNCRDLAANTLRVALLDPVNIYLKTERTAKYGILFIALTFTAFYLVEVLRRQAIHPLQYLLVGLTLSLFFLLLLSLAEHIGFDRAYLGAAAACIPLLSCYCAYVLASRAGGLLLGAILALLYAALYVIIGSEDYALLMGSGLLFLVLAGVMLLTRRVDWYALDWSNGRKPAANR